MTSNTTLTVAQRMDVLAYVTQKRAGFMTLAEAIGVRAMTLDATRLLSPVEFIAEIASIADNLEISVMVKENIDRDEVKDFIDNGPVGDVSRLIKDLLSLPDIEASDEDFERFRKYIQCFRECHYLWRIQ